MAYANFLKETVELQKAYKTNEYGQLDYLVPIKIKCRYESTVKKVFDKNGDEHISSARVYTNSIEISLEDKICDKQILSIKDIKDFRAKVVGREVYLR